MIDNPKRPPRGWFRRCMKGVQKSGARNPNAVCGSVWYHKLDAAGRRRVMREEEGYAENPSTGAYVAGAAAAAAVLAWVFWPKKAEAKPMACATEYEVKSFIAGKGLSVVLVTIIPSVAPAEFNVESGRLYNTTDCLFYRYLSLDGAKSVWEKDTALNTEFAAWRQQ